MLSSGLAHRRSEGHLPALRVKDPRSAEDDRQDAHRIRVLAEEVSRQEIRYPLLGMAEPCEHLARHVDMLAAGIVAALRGLDTARSTR
jgi:hypothetical protein